MSDPHTTPDPRDVDGSPENFLLKVALLRRAAQVAATVDPLSMTFRAAARIMEIKLSAQFTRYLDRPEQTAVVQEMIADLRQVISNDPENAGPWVSALRALRSAEEKMCDPNQWTLQVHHKELAAKALGCQLRDVHDVRIDAAGSLVARRIGEAFTTVATFDMTTA